MQKADPEACQVMERLHNLESLVEELGGQLEQANSAMAGSASSGASRVNSLVMVTIMQTNKRAHCQLQQAALGCRISVGGLSYKMRAIVAM